MTQEQEISRVGDRITHAVAAFCSKPRRFHMEELTAFVAQEVGKVAPDSPGRILRDLRARGLIKYSLLSRSASLYEITE